MPSSHLILCHPLLLLPSIFPSIRVISNASAIRIRWPKYWSFASTSLLPMNTDHQSPLGWTGWISLQSKGLSKVFSNTTGQKYQSFGASFLHSPTVTSIHDHWKNHSLDWTDLCWQSSISAFKMLSRLVITFLPRSKCLLISWLQSPSAVILDPQK